MSGDSENFPHKMTEISGEEKEAVFKLFPETVIDNFVRIGPKDYWFPVGIKDMAPQIYNMPLRQDDIWVVTFPKTGTTLTQELVWLVANDLDFDAAAATPLIERFPFLEASMFFKSKKAQDFFKASGYDAERLMPLTKSFELVDGLPSPRFIKSHMPMSLLPPALLDTCKVVYVARDPRDVVVSFYHHYKFFKFMGFTYDLKEYWKLFIENKIDYTPFFAHIKETWELRNHPNLLFLFYEDLLKDMPTAVKQVAEFLGKTVTEEQLGRMCNHLSFENFRKNKSVNYELVKEIGDFVNKDLNFCRKGKAGGWRESFDEEMLQQAERWMADNLRDTDLRFPTQ